mgnify:CR=1 FL=1
MVRARHTLGETLERPGHVHVVGGGPTRRRIRGAHRIGQLLLCQTQLPTTFIQTVAVFQLANIQVLAHIVDTRQLTKIVTQFLCMNKQLVDVATDNTYLYIRAGRPALRARGGGFRVSRRPVIEEVSR